MRPECQRRKGLEPYGGNMSGKQRQPICDRPAAGGRSAPDAPARGAGRAAVPRRRPPCDGRSAACRGAKAGRSRSRWRPSTTRCTSSPRPACCARSWSSRPQSYFDTNTGDHQHFYRRERRRADRHSRSDNHDRRPADAAQGHGCQRVDVVVRVKRALTTFLRTFAVLELF